MPLLLLLIHFSMRLIPNLSRIPQLHLIRNSQCRLLNIPLYHIPHGNLLIICLFQHLSLLTQTYVILHLSLQVLEYPQCLLVFVVF